MLLRESSRVLNQSVNMEAVVDPSSTTEDYGFPAGAELMAFATAANRAANPIMAADIDEADLGAELVEARDRLIAEVGREGLIEAAATVAAFNGLVRVADGTGIELDDGLNEVSADLRSELKLDDLAGSVNTTTLIAEPPEVSSATGQDADEATAVARLFS